MIWTTSAAGADLPQLIREDIDRYQELSVQLEAYVKRQNEVNVAEARSARAARKAAEERAAALGVAVEDLAAYDKLLSDSGERQRKRQETIRVLEAGIRNLRAEGTVESIAQADAMQKQLDALTKIVDAEGKRLEASLKSLAARRSAAEFAADTVGKSAEEVELLRLEAELSAAKTEGGEGGDSCDNRVEASSVC